jgi:lipid II:glycine glycyltransferase (peptidoglycan interpeptide bridge formation enzyme)
MTYQKVKAITKDNEVVKLETLKNGVSSSRSVAFKDVPMILEVNGTKTTISINELVKMLYNEIDKVRKEIKHLEGSLRENDAKLEKGLRKIAEQVDKITVHLNQEGSVVGW